MKMIKTIKFFKKLLGLKTGSMDLNQKSSRKLKFRLQFVLGMLLYFVH